jgi:hypothetical protein
VALESLTADEENPCRMRKGTRSLALRAPPLAAAFSWEKASIRAASNRSPNCSRTAAKISRPARGGTPTLSTVPRGTLLTENERREGGGEGGPSRTTSAWIRPLRLVSYSLSSLAAISSIMSEACSSVRRCQQRVRR